MKQTAIEFYAEKEIKLTLDFISNKLNELEYGIKRIKLIEQAKEMFKEQIRIAYMEGAFEKMRHLDGKEFMMPTEYYNKTFKSE
jgi:hypothetical protein